jgi:hypothetical protein
MAAATVEEMDMLFDEHPSLAGSMDDFDPNDTQPRDFSPPVYGIPSQHSGFRSNLSDSSELSSPQWAPAWRKQGTPWYNNNHGLHHRHGNSHTSGSSSAHHSRFASLSRGASPYSESGSVDGDPDITLAAHVPLPESPLKRTPQPSMEPEEDYSRRHGGEVEVSEDAAPESTNGYIRFAVRAEVQHRTEPLDSAIIFCRDLYNSVTKSRTSLFFAVFVGIISLQILRSLARPPSEMPVPDLVKVAGLAKSFEPLMYYSETGLQQISTLQESSMAVWDLGESVRANNITSGTVIAKQLDELSDDLRMLSMDLTKFFSSVNGDVDSIIIVMEWAHRELSHVSALPCNAVTSTIDNVHGLLSRAGVLETATGTPTFLGSVTRDVFGQTNSQRTRDVLHRTFAEFLNVIEDSISNELAFSTPLLALFEEIDAKYSNLHRTVLRESAQQEREEGEMLASLWTKLVGGPNRSALRKFEKNRQLLGSVRARTVRNKHVLVDHNARLLQLKGGLESLRKRVVSPLVRSNVSSTLTVQEQIRGLEGGFESLSKAREWQKDKLREALTNAGSRIGSGLVIEEGGYEIDGK